MKKNSVGSQWNQKLLRIILISGEIPLDLNEICDVNRTTITRCLEKMSSDAAYRSPKFDPPGITDEESWYYGAPLMIRRKYQKRKPKPGEPRRKAEPDKNSSKSITSRVTYTVSQHAIDRGIADEYGYEKYFEELTRVKRANSKLRSRNINESYVVTAMNVIATDVFPEEKYMGDLMEHDIPYSFDRDSDVFYFQKEIRYLNSVEDDGNISETMAGEEGKEKTQIFQSKCIGLWMAPCNVNYAVYNFEDKPNYWIKRAESRAVTNMQAFIGSPLNKSDRNREIKRALILGRKYKEILRQLKAEIEIFKINMEQVEKGAKHTDLRTKYNNRFRISQTVYNEVYYIPHKDCRYILPLFRLMYKDSESGVFKIKEIAEEFFMEKLNVDNQHEKGTFEIKDNWECDGEQAFILRVRDRNTNRIQEIHLFNGTIIHYESCLYYRLRLDFETEESKAPTRLIIGCLTSQKEFYEKLFEDYIGRNVMLKECGSAEELLNFSKEYLAEEDSLRILERISYA